MQISMVLQGPLRAWVVNQQCSKVVEAVKVCDNGGMCGHDKTSKEVRGA